MNPVFVKRRTKLFFFMILFELALIIGAILLWIVVKTGGQCIEEKMFLLCMPISLFFYYRIWSKILLKLIDCITCQCAEHGWGYAVLHYMVWATIGHPWVLFFLYVYNAGVRLSDIYSHDGIAYCAAMANASQTSLQYWRIGYTVMFTVFTFVVFMAGLVVSVRNHKDVKFQLDWKEEDETTRVNRIQNALNRDATLTYVFGGVDNNHNNHSDNALNANNLGNNGLAVEMRPAPPNANHENHLNHNNNNGAAAAAPAEHAAEDSELRRVIRMSILSAETEDVERRRSEREDRARTEEEEEARVRMDAEFAAEEERLAAEAEDEFPDRNAPAQVSASVGGFWAKATDLSSGVLGNMFKTQDVECIICYEDYAVGQRIAVLKCGHKFHKACAAAWLAQNPTCPMCRTNVLRDGL